MAKKIIHCTSFDTSGVLTAKTVTEAYINGYQVAERFLEDVPIRIFHRKDNEIDAEIILDNQTLRSLRINKKSVRGQVLAAIENGEYDVLSSTIEMDDDDICIYDDALSLEAQPASYSTNFKFDPPE